LEQIDPTSEEFRSDGFKIAIAIEGGGMRGCVAAGIVSVSISYT
jgi:predicted patatin/cPLA2 family phospholipase